MDVDVEYFEYDCGWPCTPSGCPGHITDIPTAIIIDGERFAVEGGQTLVITLGKRIPRV